MRRSTAGQAEEITGRSKSPRLKRICGFISPCPAEMTAAKNPIGTGHSDIDLVVSVSEIYPALCAAMKHAQEPGEELACAGRTGIGWGRSGGEAAATPHDISRSHLASGGMLSPMWLQETGR